MELSVASHRPAHVEQHNRRATRLVLRVVNDEIVLVTWIGVTAPLANQGVLERLVEIEIGDRIAVHVGLRFLMQNLTRAFVGGFMFAQCVFAGDGEEFLKGLGLCNSLDALRRDGVLAFLILFQKALFHQQAQQIMFVLVKAVQMAKQFLAMFERTARRDGRTPSPPIAARTTATRPIASIRTTAWMFFSLRSFRLIAIRMRLMPSPSSFYDGIEIAIAQASSRAPSGSCRQTPPATADRRRGAGLPSPAPSCRSLFHVAADHLAHAVARGRCRDCTKRPWPGCSSPGPAECASARSSTWM